MYFKIPFLFVKYATTQNWSFAKTACFVSSFSNVDWAYSDQAKLKNCSQ